MLAGLWLCVAPFLLMAAQQPTFIELEPPKIWQRVRSEKLRLGQIQRWGSIPAVDREYGVKEVRLETYEHNGAQLQVAVEKASDPAAADGLLMFYETAEMRPVPGMSLAVRGPDGALMSRGRRFLRVLSLPRAKLAGGEVRSLLMQLGGPEPGAGTLQMLPPSLPSEGFIQGSEKYLLGPEATQRALPWLRLKLIDFNLGAEIQSAAYVRDGVRLDFLIISYPTPQLAQAAFESLEKGLGLNRTPTLRGKRSGAFVFLVRSHPANPVLAEALMHQMQVKKTVTWDQRLPRGQPVDLQVVNLILGNVMLVLILAGMAVLAGILMVILRRLLSRWFPQSDWAQQGDDSFIQLKLR